MDQKFTFCGIRSEVRIYYPFTFRQEEVHFFSSFHDASAFAEKKYKELDGKTAEPTCISVSMLLESSLN
jgi:hypothetical protein